MDENIAGMDVAVGAVGSGGERRSSVLSTAQDDGAVAAPGQRWSLARKREVVLRLMQGEPVEGVELHAVPIDSDLLPQCLSQAMRSFDDVPRARHAARRQQDPMETPQCQVG